MSEGRAKSLADPFTQMRLVYQLSPHSRNTPAFVSAIKLSQGNIHAQRALLMPAGPKTLCQPADLSYSSFFYWPCLDDTSQDRDL